MGQIKISRGGLGSQKFLATNSLGEPSPLKNMNTITNTKQVNLIPYKKSLSIIEKNATALSIKTEAEIKLASDILFQISALQTKIKGEKAKIVSPAKEIIAWANTTFGPIEKQCEKAEYIIKEKMIYFDTMQRKKAEKELAKIANKVTAGKIDLETASKKIEGLAPANSYEGEAGAIQFRINRVIEITDEKKIPRKYLEPNLVLIRTDALKGVEIPGVKVKEEKIVAKGRV